jgi:pimeloyl-ACP methyl ester carboxylesterase
MCLAFDAAIALSPDELERVRVSMAPYVTPELRYDPRRFFAFLDHPQPPRLLTSTRRRTIPGGTIVGRRFASGYERFAADPDDAAVTCKENAFIPVEHWMHDHRPAATVIALHGFTMGQPRFDAFVLMAMQWFKLGLDVALVTLPFHGARCPRTARYSGELFGSWNVGRLNESVRQSVHDVDLVMRWMASDSDAPVGIIGLSLGGYVTSVLASVRSTPAFVVPVVPAVSLAALPSQLFALSRHRRTDPPLSLEQLEVAYRVHSPLTYELAVPKERVLIIAGRGDRIVPPEHPYALWKHWDEPAIHWYSGSHFAPFRRPDILAAGQRHLEQLGIL